MSPAEIQQIISKRRGIPDRTYQENLPNGRINYYIGTNDNRLRIITKFEYDAIVNPVTPVINNITNITGSSFTAGGDLSGTDTNQTVIGLQTVPVDSAAPALNDVLTFDGTQWTPQPSGGSGSASSLLIDYVATVNIAIYDVVTSLGTKANSNTTSQKNKVIGIATANVLSGFAGQVVGFGKIVNPGWAWTIGDKLFLNGTSISTTAPSTGYSLILGTATASDTIDLKISQSVLL